MDKEKLACCQKNSNNEIIKLKEFLKIISVKNRIRIVCLLRHKEMCVCEIYKNLKLSQNLTSHHLKILEEAEIVSCEKRGVKVFYKLNKSKIKSNIKLVNKFLKT